MPIVAVAMKAISKRLPSTFQYLGLVAFANYLLQAFFGYKIGLAILKDRLLAALAGAFFTLAPPFVLRTGFHFSLSSQWLILAALWLIFSSTRDAPQNERPCSDSAFSFFSPGASLRILRCSAFLSPWQPFCLRSSERAATGRAGPFCGWRCRWCCFFPDAFGFFKLDMGAGEHTARAIATTR
jgi:hypothetical protein